MYSVKKQFEKSEAQKFVFVCRVSGGCSVQRLCSLCSALDANTHAGESQVKPVQRSALIKGDIFDWTESSETDVALQQIIEALGSKKFDINLLRYSNLDLRQ